MENNTARAAKRKDGTGLSVKRHSIWNEMYKFRHIYIILLPVILFYIIFCYLPMFGVVIAFQNYSVTKGVFGSTFVGLENFINFLSDTNFWRLIKNTVSISLLQLLFSFPAPIIFALMLNEVRNDRFKRIVQTVTYMPHFISVVVVASLVLTFVSSDGAINMLRVLFGQEKISFMTKPQYFYPIYVISDIWQHLGWNSIIYISALASIDQGLYEAAKIDGAGRWKQLLHVTMPGILPTIIVMLIMRIGQILNVGFEKIMLLYNPTIYSTADVVSTYVYRRGILDGAYSYSAAVGFFNSVVNLLLLVSANFISKKTTETALW